MMSTTQKPTGPTHSTMTSDSGSGLTIDLPSITRSGIKILSSGCHVPVTDVGIPTDEAGR